MYLLWEHIRGDRTRDSSETAEFYHSKDISFLFMIRSINQCANSFNHHLSLRNFTHNEQEMSMLGRTGQLLLFHISPQCHLLYSIRNPALPTQGSHSFCRKNTSKMGSTFDTIATFKSGQGKK